MIHREHEVELGHKIRNTIVSLTHLYQIGVENEALEQIVRELRDWDLDAIECYYSKLYIGTTKLLPSFKQSRRAAYQQITVLHCEIQTDICANVGLSSPSVGRLLSFFHCRGVRLSAYCQTGDRTAGCPASLVL